jgi:hypothetical protein
MILARPISLNSVNAHDPPREEILENSHGGQQSQLCYIVITVFTHLLQFLQC